MNRLIRFVSFFLAASTLHASNEFIIEAPSFDAGNVTVSRHGEIYADGEACIWNGGPMPNRATYVLDLPVSANYTLHGLYAAAASRPVDILVDGKQVHTGFTGITGAWQTSTARWERQVTVTLAAGRHVFLLEREGPIPHICALKLTSDAPFPGDWTLRRLTVQERQAWLRCREAMERLRAVDTAVMRWSVENLARRYPDRYDATRQREAVDRLEKQRADLLERFARGETPDAAAVDGLLNLSRTPLLANPLLDVDRILVVKRNLGSGPARSATGGDAGFVPHNYENHVHIPRRHWDNEIAVLSNLRGTPKLEPLFEPPDGHLVRDIRLHYDAKRIMFSMRGTGHWAVHEVDSTGGRSRQLSPTNYPDLDFFDPCYLPDGRIIVCSTGGYYGLPCLSGDGIVASLYLLDPAAGTVRQLTFDQDSGNDPVVLPDGRVLYQRWEYSDIPHYFSRRRMMMRPDGSCQMAIYGSNSWFPTAFRFARPVPGHPSLLVGVISGHHDYGDCGRLALLDPGLASAYPFRYRPTSKEWGVPGQKIALTPDILPAEDTGFVQLIPGWNKPVAGTVCDAIVTDVYLKEHPALATHPYPLSSEYFLVSMKPTQNALWGIYLVDIFDNATLIAECEDAALFEPVPFRTRPREPVLPDGVDTRSKTADVRITDIYAGPGLRGVPRGTVKRLRIFAYHFGYLRKAGFERVGTQSGWDVKRVLGTTGVEADGSAHFTIPANTPISIQPLDAEGRAVQLMRSWLIGMPGEQVSCLGCHENRLEGITNVRTLADRRGADTLTPWFGPPRPFDFRFEVYPVLQRYCIGCHEAPPKVGPRSKPSFKNPDVAYDTLHPYVHRPGPESDMALHEPMEYHASTSPLIQMLGKGHHGVTLSAMTREARERLYCWIDLNVPKNGRWEPPAAGGFDQVDRRIELAKAFAGIETDPEGEYRHMAQADAQREPVRFEAPPEQELPAPDGLAADGFPISAEAARDMQAAGAEEAVKTLDLGDGVTMVLRRIPTGEFIMGSQDGAPDEQPRGRIRIARAFWMAELETSNAQFARFNPAHDTGYIDMHYMDRVTPGYVANHSDQPVARVSWQEAMAFCGWLSHQTGLKISLPTEAQWEWAARAGTGTQFYYGTMETDFGRFANLADQSIRWFKMGFPGASALQPRFPYPPEMNFPLHDERFRDNWHVVDYVGQGAPNAWGLKDMVGNVSEWTGSDYSAYPYNETDGRNGGDPAKPKVARGGSWADRPADAGSAVRRAYESWQRVYDVGFRVVAE